MATAILSSEGPETLDCDLDRFDKQSSPSNSANSGGGSACGDNNEGGKVIERYVKFFTIKSVQVVVQSRLGKKVKTDSKPHSTGTDWVSNKSCLSWDRKFETQFISDLINHLIIFIIQIIFPVQFAY